MYVTSRRYLDPERFQGSVAKQGSTFVGPINFTTPRLVEGVYSWRTGARAVSDPAESPTVQGQRLDGYGIRTPTNRGSLVDRLADRKRYMEEFQRAAFPAETQTGSTSTDRTSTTDSGHLFASHKTYRMPFRGTLDFQQGSYASYTGDVWGSVSANDIVNPSPYAFPFVGANTGAKLIVSETNRQARANEFFASTAPDRNDASVAVTLIELLRGDIPSILRNFQEMMAGMRSIKNLLGSDYLNITFGWTPLIQEYANLIRVGMNLERVIYYESFRRKRQWDGPTLAWNPGITSVMLDMSSGPFLNRTYPQPGEVTGGSFGYGVSFVADSSAVASENYHFTSKYTGLAKASRRANSFSDQAMDVVKRLGLVDDPRLLWDLTPYSWLVDWFSSMGASVANASVYAPKSGKYSVDYAYMTTQHTHHIESQLVRPSVTSAYVKSYSVTRSKSWSTSVTKWRSRATPFGFGTQLGSLSASQYAILVALGLARTR